MTRIVFDSGQVLPDSVLYKDMSVIEIMQRDASSLLFKASKLFTVNRVAPCILCL